MGVVQPVERGFNAWLHFLETRIAGVGVDRLRVKLMQQVIPQNAGDDAGDRHLGAVVADPGFPHTGRHIDQVAHHVLRAGSRGALVGQAHGEAAECQDIGEIADDLGIACGKPRGVFEEPFALSPDHIGRCGVEVPAHPERVAQVPVHRRGPGCDQISVAADVHFGRRGGDDVEIDDQDRRVAGVNRALDPADEHDGGVVGKRVHRERGLNDDQRKGILLVRIEGAVLAQVTDGARADPDDAVLAGELFLNLRGVFRRAVHDALRLADDKPLHVKVRLKLRKDLLLDGLLLRVGDDRRTRDQKDLLPRGQGAHRVIQPGDGAVIDQDRLHVDVVQLFRMLLLQHDLVQLIQLRCVGFYQSLI